MNFYLCHTPEYQIAILDTIQSTKVDSKWIWFLYFGPLKFQTNNVSFATLHINYTCNELHKEWAHKHNNFSLTGQDLVSNMIFPLESTFFLSARHSITIDLHGSHDFAWKMIHWCINRIKSRTIFDIMQYWKRGSTIN